MKITMKNEKIIKVLVADNSEFAKNNLRDFLESSEGIQLINVVDNGKDAYHFIMDETPDIVLIDGKATFFDESLHECEPKYRGYVKCH